MAAFSNFSLLQNHLGGLLKHRCLGPSRRVLKVHLGWGSKIAFLTNYQAMPRMLPQVPHSENHDPRTVVLNSGCTLASPGEIEKRKRKKNFPQNHLKDSDLIGLVHLPGSDPLSVWVVVTDTSQTGELKNNRNLVFIILGAGNHGSSTFSVW